MKIKLNKIKIDKGTQIREKINHQTVGEYAQVISEGGVLPPVDVFFDGIDYYLVDGFHRYFAHKQIVAPEIEANIHSGVLRDAILFAIGSNKAHGLPRTAGDKKNAVLALLMDKEWKKLSEREIAKIAGVSHVFVGNIRKSMQIEKPPVREVVRDGKKFEMDTSNIQGEKETEIDTELDEVHELEVTNKALTEEIDALNDQLAVASLSGEDKSRAEETIGELRTRIKNLEVENESLKSSLQTYMTKNSEMVKQLNYYKRRIEKMEKAAA